MCLEPTCEIKIGCSYCFLKNHENHFTCEVKKCIGGLQELAFKIDANN